MTLQPHELALVLGVEISDGYSPQFNAAPTKSLPVILSNSNDQLSFQKWGLMSMWSNNKAMSPKFFNLPIESVSTKASYRKKLESHRCVIPMDGFYIWKKIARKQQTPYYFYYPDKRVFCVAGLWEQNEDQNSFIMIMKSANKSISSFQEDMPLIMDMGTTKKWLETKNPENLLELLSKEISDNFISHTVSPRIVNIELNDASFIKATPASDQHGNYTLFS